MTLRSWFRYRLASFVAKSAQLAIVPSWITQSVLDPSFRSLTQEGYTKNAAFLACVSALTFGVAEPPLMVYSAEEQPLRQHPLRHLLRRPNPVMSEAELWVITMAYLAIGGNAYWHKVRNASRTKVVEVWPYHAGQIVPLPGGATWVRGYTYDDGTGRLVQIPAEDIIHFKWPTPDPAQPWMAMPPLRAAAAEVDSDNEASRYLRTLLQNDAVPRTLLTQSPERFMSDDEVRRAKAQFEERYGGANRGGVLVLEAGAKVERLSLNLEEMAFEAMHNIPEARICAVMRVPPIIAGLNVGLNRSTFANYEEARRAFAQDTRVPLWRILSSEIEADADLNADNLLIHHDLSKVAALQEDQNALWKRVTDAYTAGFLDEDDARTMIGLPMMSTAQRARLVSVVATARPSPDPAPEPVKALPAPPELKATARGIGRSLQRIRLDVAQRMERALDTFFGDLADRVVARLQKAWTAPRIERKELPDAAELVTPGDQQILGQIVGDFYLEICRASWETWNVALGIDVVFGMDDPAVVEALATAGQQITRINETTLAAVQELLQYGADQGWTIDDLVRGDAARGGIRDLVAQTYKGRARAIARTELGMAQNRATSERYAAAGVSQVRVLDGGGPNSCQACNDLNGQTKTVEWSRANALGHPNCVRAFTPVFDD